MTEIIPAMMPKSLAELEESMSLVRGLVPLVQVDVMDGLFVQNKSWPYIGGVDEDFAAMVADQEDFPFLDELDFEADLMVQNPEAVWHDWVQAGATRIIIHIESFGTGPDALEKAQKFFAEVQKKVPAKESLLHVEIGVALNPDTPNENIVPLLGSDGAPALVDFVQFMGIAKIGFQGQPFDTRVPEKIADLRARFPDVIISVDGGVNLETAPALIRAGATRLVAGSAILKSADIAGTIEEFKNL